jgi:hypothetical protein
MRQLTALFLLISSIGLFAQKSPVTWQFQTQELTNNEFIVYCKAKIAKGWYIYSQHIEGTPPIPTSINISANSDFKILSDIEEKGALIDEYDEALGKNVKKYANQVSFIAKIKTHKPLVLIDGYVEFMTCDHEKCLPPETEAFQFKLQATRQEQIMVQKNAPTTITNAPKFSAESYVAPEKNINIPESSVSVSQYGQDKNNNNPTYENASAHVTSNAERTTVLENSENMVAANIMQFFTKGKQVKEQQLLAEQKVKTEKLIAAKLAAEAETQKAKTPLITEAPVEWDFDMVSLGESVYELNATVKIAENWFIYAKNNTGDAPFPLQMQFENNPNIEFLDADIQEIGQLRTEHDPLFNKEVNRYANEITLKRKVRFINNSPIKGNIKFMTASNEQYLMPTDIQFNYNNDLSVVLKSQKTNAGWWIFGAIALLLIMTSTIIGFTRKMFAKK